MKRAITCCLCGIASQLVWVQSFQAVTPSLLSSSRQPALSLEQTDLYRVHAQQYSNRLLSKGNGEEEPEAVFVEPGSEEFSKEQWAEIEEAQPSELSIMKDVSSGSLIGGVWKTRWLISFLTESVMFHFYL